MTLLMITDTGPEVATMQAALTSHGFTVSADGDFGPKTAEALRLFQKSMNLDADGVCGPQTWARLMNRPPPLTAPSPSPACKSALRDASKRWPGRSKASDGIMGDVAHQKRKSDHNIGNAVDITHDVKSGCDGHIVSELALRDPRVTYVIWNRKIARNPGREWREYKGSNPHLHHVHISVDADKRHDDSQWPWAEEDV